MKEKIKVGYIGLGGRGMSVLKLCFSDMQDVEIRALCDWEEDRVQQAVSMLNEKGKPSPYTTTDYKEILADDEIDAVIIMTGWHTHVKLAKESMLAGKYTAVEVGCAYDIQECHDLIEAYEKTGAPLMMLENCCYGRNEMMLLNIVKQGLLGEVVHCKGGYCHYLPEMELFKERDKPHYRIFEYINRNCEQYPTHELGPIMKVLDINRGNRMMKLTSVASKSRGLKAYAKEHLPADSIFNNVEYKQGDIVTTCITCANGETIQLSLDTTLPRAFYSRDFTVRGTKGMYSEERNVMFFEGDVEGEFDNVSKYYEKYDHPLHAEYVQGELKGGHGGMDWLVCRAFVESVKRGINTPIDAYDTVALMAIGPLSEMSIQKGGMPVDIPDFTKGKWMRREPAIDSKYCLDKVVVDQETPIFQ
ncbi:MAG: Gfo/Idh/MocA family oxidoreductase [Roseburia sp.]|nr:Gfo/Idh/MocA family oxidoreductase [Roseburia sp.]